LRQELGIYEGAKQRVTNIALQSPQTLRLRGGQSEPRHLDELSLYSLEHFIDEHGIIPLSSSSETDRWSCCVAA
jgi:hypothetical protein